MKNKNHGYIRDEIKDEDYVLGSGQLPAEVLQPDGDWTPYLPALEIQNKPFVFDTQSCVSFGTLNALEILLHRKFALEENYSDRFLAIVSGTSRNGNTPNVVAETIRKQGCIEEDLLPFLDDIDTWEKYHSPMPMKASLLRRGLYWLTQWEYGHDWVFTDSDSREERKQKMMEALKYSPLGVAVKAWQSRDGLYYKEEGSRDNHWCTLVRYKEGEWWEVFDQYEKSIKRLEWDYDFDRVKRYTIFKKAPEAPQKTLGELLWAWLMELVEKWIRRMDTV